MSEPNKQGKPRAPQCDHGVDAGEPVPAAPRLIPAIITCNNNFHEVIVGLIHAGCGHTTAPL
eukprot:scaffold3057_cov153-Pinguiococcus_pyrenoidosus.AAC.2